jgi:hypothetical protein
VKQDGGKVRFDAGRDRAELPARSGEPQAASFRDELLSIAELADRHRDEFDELLAAMGDTVRLSDVRKQRGRRQ